MSFSPEMVLSAPEFLRRKIKPRRWLITGLLKERDLAEIAGYRGRGKTRFAMSLLHAISTGVDFLGYKVPKARPVLLFQGEEPEADLQELVRSIGVPSENFQIITGEEYLTKNDDPIDLADEKQQKAFIAFVKKIKKRPAVIVFDNLSQLARLDENARDDRKIDFSRFLTRLRFAGFCIIFLHHAGRNDQARGHSGLEDNLDFVLRLAADGKTEEGGARIKLDFTKSRRLKPELHNTTWALKSSEANPAVNEWVQVVKDGAKDSKFEPRFILLQFIAKEKPATQKFIANKKIYGTAQAISSKCRKLEADGFLNGLIITKKGTAKIHELILSGGGRKP